MLASQGWYLKVFTPNPWKSKGNIEILPMTIEEFDELILKYCEVHPHNFINEHGVPDKLVSDYYPAYGQIFQDYIRGFQFWAHTNWDMVYGRLDHYIPDETLENCDIWTDDVGAINGILTIYRNRWSINNLFRYVPNWKESFVTHEATGFDEIQMTRALKTITEETNARILCPPYFPFHSYDRLIQHQPKPNIYFEKDGALIERFEDSRAARGFYGREIMTFHFSRTKQWPIKMLSEEEVTA